MGGKAASGTAGYHYFLGLHAVFCHGPIDRFSRITVDDRVAWEGLASSGTIEVTADDLFGGDDREGGVSGAVDIEMGAPTQTKNAYLLSKIGPAIPAFRQVAAMVFKDFYWGNNPYLKPVRTRGRRIYTAQDGADQWYMDKAGIPSSEGSTATWVEICTVVSSHVGEYPDATQCSISYYAAGGGDGFGLGDCPNYQRQFAINTMVGPVDFDAIHTAHPASNIVMVGFIDEFNQFYSNGPVYNLVVTEPDAFDMNPAHVIREALTNQDWGLGYAADDIDDDSFTAAADRLYDERLGVSILWDQQATLEDFINEIVRHADAALFVSRTTGKFKLVLIRDDYDPLTLPVFDESNVSRVADPSRPAFGELLNSITIQFWNRDTGADDSLTVQDPAGVQQQGDVINTAVQYQGFTHGVTAMIAGARDLRALSNPFFSCTVYTGEDARDLEVAGVFVLSWGKWNINSTVMRITGVAIAEGTSQQVRLTCVEDVFATELTAVLAPPNDGWTDPSQPPVAALATLAFEVPYYELVQAAGQTQTDSQLADDPAAGLVGATAVRADNSIAARMWTDAGAGYARTGLVNFCPSGLLVADIGKTDTEGQLASYVDLDLVTEGTHFQIDDELLRIDVIDPDTGEMEFGRGVLDTVPAAHATGARAFFWDDFGGFDSTQYDDGETVDVKLTPVSGQGVLDIADAAVDEVTLASRAYRPYPPGDLRINGDSYLDDVYAGELTISWVDRDRLLETGGTLIDHFDGPIGPEAGTTYRVRAYLDNVLVDTLEPAVSGLTYSAPGDGLLRIEADSTRDGVYSWQAATHEFFYVSEGAGRTTEAGELRYTEAGDIRVTED